MGGDYTYVTIRRWGSLGITLEVGYHNWFVGNFLKLIITSTNTNKNVPGIRVWILKHWNSQPYVGGGLNRDNTESRSLKNPLRV